MSPNSKIFSDFLSSAHPEMMCHFLETYPDFQPDIRSLRSAAKNPNYHSLRLLLSVTDRPVSDFIDAAVGAAASRDNLDNLLLLIQLGFNPSKTRLCSICRIALQNSSFKVLKYFLDNGLNWDDFKGESGTLVEILQPECYPRPRGVVLIPTSSAVRTILHHFTHINTPLPPFLCSRSQSGSCISLDRVRSGQPAFIISGQVSSGQVQVRSTLSDTISSLL